MTESGGRPERPVTLRSSPVRVTINIPAELHPDVIRFRGGLFVPNRDGSYRRADVWPVIETLDRKLETA
jgi:hypothetical protein